MKNLLLVLFLSSLTFWLGSCFVIAAPAFENYPIISISEVKATDHNEFNVRGYIVSIVECPKGSMCVIMDGVQISQFEISPGSAPETIQKLRADGHLIFLSSDKPSRLNFEQGRRYIISYEVGKGIVGATLDE